MERKILFTLSFCLIINLTQAQKKDFHVAVGSGFPDLMHIGINWPISKINRVGLYLGNRFYPSRKPSLSLDHKVAISKNKKNASWSTWFLGQRFTYTHLYQRNSKWQIVYFTPTLGKEFYLNKSLGFNLDAGVFLWLWKKETKLNRNPCLCEENTKEYDVLPSARLQLFYRIN